MKQRTGKPPAKEELLAQTRTFVKDYVYRNAGETVGKAFPEEIERLIEKQRSKLGEEAEKENLERKQAARAAEFSANMEKFSTPIGSSILKKKKAFASKA